MELPITEVPNVETFYHIKGGFWNEIMLAFLDSLGWDLCTDDRYRVLHDGTFGVDKGKRSEYMKECKNKYYLVSGDSPRGIRHICIYKNGKLIHDPHPTKEGLVTVDTFQTLEKIKP